MTTSKPQTTDFTKDVLGRYINNGLDEALNSTNGNGQRPDGSPTSDAQQFDVIVIGGGSFGPVFAQHLFSNDHTHSHRILVLDAGSLLLTEHVQNYPPIGLGVPPPTESDPFQLRNEVWGLPWRSDVPQGFPGLAYCTGGRSLYFGGWSPQLLDTPTDTEMPRDRWPDSVVKDLNNKYFSQAAQQIGTDQTNDFISGEMHDALRKQLFEGIKANKVPDAIKLSKLPLHLDLPPGIPAALKEQFKLEAPLTVKSRAGSGLFPFNKFSSMPLLIAASRAASTESTHAVGYPDDIKKRLMVVPHCHVIRLVTNIQNGIGRVTGVECETSLPICGDSSNVQKQRITIPVSDNANVVIALGTIESARLALLSFQGIKNYDKIGTNLMAHLRSNITISIPRTSLSSLDPTVKALQASALFVKGSHSFKDGSGKGYFHLQITAAGLDKLTSDSEAELFKKIPDLDNMLPLQEVNDNTIVITIRGIGEIQGQNPGNKITLSGETDEVGVQRAFVTYNLGEKDFELWDAMDKASDDVARVFAGGHNFTVFKAPDRPVTVSPTDDLSQVLPYTPVWQGGRRDGMGTTHHEAGPLWMGVDSNTSVTNTDTRFHFVENAYVAGPALFPTVGSPNPMLTGVALARRLADHLTVGPFKADAGFTLLFDGADTSKWRLTTIQNQANNFPGGRLVVDRALETVPGNDLGMFWHTDPTPHDFVLKLEWLRWREDDNSGIFIRFPHPDSKGYNNTAYVAVNFGFEIQIDQLARPDGSPLRKTGAIYGFAAPSDPNNLPVKPVGEWNEFQIHVQGQHYTVFLNGVKITEYNNTDPNRGQPSTGSNPSFIGIQNHTGRVAFRKIQIKAL
ncbi:MAG TPA: family 16 glycoside hydrolase [Nitrosospira sp.]|nr:family 16 glycoside hydrolase [Nitrosospira sp.]